MSESSSTSKLSRRAMLRGTATAAAAAGMATAAGCQLEARVGAKAGGGAVACAKCGGKCEGGACGCKACAAALKSYKASGENINQSVVHWCFSLSDEHKLNKKHKPIDVPTLAGHAKKMGVKSVELIGPEHFKTLANAGMVCAIAPNGMPGWPFIKGLNNKKYHAEVIKNTKASIDACAEYKFPCTIAFNGFKYVDAEDPKSGEISLDEGAATTVEGLKKLASYAEKKKVTVCLEMLNTRDGTHPMKGHPGYQGDDMDYCADIINKVGSPYVKLLFDVYHVQIMDGDVIRRIRQYKDIIGHYHTAGCPGRNEIDNTQETNYVGVMQAIAETGYEGHVGQEFIPTWDDPIAALGHAVKVCDV